jgi:hypothetical protein
MDPCLREDAHAFNQALMETIQELYLMIELEEAERLQLLAELDLLNGEDNNEKKE